ncbi:hypothetical protein [Caulobacter sp. UC70_42]|uniref:hypothetical protein n=1 Tax=Caulobacter sp. UC70_42 TaxID=3374551 RepID=UPI0037564F5D
MTISIPSLPQHEAQELKLVSSATNATPQFGGPVQRISRLGDRFTLTVNTRKLSYTQGASVVAALLQGLSNKVTCPVQQPGLAIGSPGNPTVVSGSGTTLTLTGFTNGYAIRSGQLFSIVHGGKRYLHMATAAATAAGGAATLTVFPMLRTPMTSGDAAEFANPQIEGFLADTSQGWSVGLSQAIGLTFSISEAA